MTQDGAGRQAVLTTRRSTRLTNRYKDDTFRHAVLFALETYALTHAREALMATTDAHTTDVCRLPALAFHDGHADLLAPWVAAGRSVYSITSL